MPELPEVETICRGLSQQLVGTRITDCHKHRQSLRFPIPESFPKKIINKKIAKIDRRGKYILMVFENELTVIIHLGMSGRVLLNEKPYPKREKHDHITAELSSGKELVYRDPRRFGFFDIIQSSDLKSYKAFKKMGPEPFDENLEAYLYEASRHKTCSLKSFLLNQEIIAGLGNIYVCESLYWSNLSPIMKPADLTKANITSLVKSIRSVLNNAIQSGGSTLKDFRTSDGSLGYFQHQWAVYGRKGEACPSCDCDIIKTSGIQQIQQSGRSTFYCAVRQKVINEGSALKKK